MKFTLAMMSPSSPRLMALLDLLQAHGQLGGAELATRLGVDRRTIRRDILRLEDLGISVAAERGAEGGYRLLAGSRLPPLRFTEPEAVALSLGLLTVNRLGLADATAAIASAQAKLERAFPGDLQARNRTLGASIALGHGAPSPPSASGAWLLALSVAAQRRQRLELGYQAEGHPGTQRAFDCYGLVHRNGRWYALGYCHLRHAVRSFRLDRIQFLRERDESFSPPEGFDAREHLVHGIASLPRGIRVAVFLHTDLETARAALPEGIGLLKADGPGVLLHGETGDLAWYARKLAGLPFDVDILEPQRLRSALIRLATRLLKGAKARR